MTNPTNKEMGDASKHMPLKTDAYALEAGVLTLTSGPSDGPDIFRIAERINPKRAFLFVSTVLGRHIPVEPSLHRAALQTLAQGVSGHLLNGPVFVMGFAETAVGIGAGIFDCLRLSDPAREMGYLTTTRFAPVDAGIWFSIEESHSHAVDHIILEPSAGVIKSGHDATLVLVDDETTTGKTFAKLAAELRDKGLIFGSVVLVTLTDWSNGRAVAAVGDIYPEGDVHSVCLQKGSWSWVPDDTREPMDLPGPCKATVPLWAPLAAQPYCAPRTGLSTQDARQDGEDILSDLVAHGLLGLQADDRTLVIGAGEHVWQPMLVAEAISLRGIYVRFITTTRSPILIGDTIKQKLTFPDHYGQGFQMYLHNIVPSEWNRILLFTETGHDGICATLIEAMGRLDVIDGAGHVSVFSAGSVPR
ncbi:MAG: hypothetical protein ACI853_000406 [Paracoccaceae bacterium]|jgi:hypothetical protein